VRDVVRTAGRAYGLTMNPLRALACAVAAALDRPLARACGGRLLVALSGGPDSTALLDVLESLAPARGLTLFVASVDHGLRPASAHEAATVVSGALGRGLAATVLRVQVRGRSMAAARRARYEALVAEAGRVEAGGIVVAHTATDQAETMLDRLVRGAGTRGLAAMAHERPIDGRLASPPAGGPADGAAVRLALLRPLLGVARAEVEAYIVARGLAVVRDPTNDDRHYRRSRLRHEVLPLLRRERADLDHALAATCDRLRADAAALDLLAGEAAARLRLPDGALDAAGLAALPEALFARVVALAAPVPLTAAHVAGLARLCADRRGTRSLDLPAHVRAERRYQRLYLPAPVESSAAIVTEEVAVTSPGLYVLGSMAVEVTEALYTSLGAQPLVLRHVREGDRAPSGKLQDLLVNAKVPRPERRHLPVLARGTEVVWVRGLRLTGPSAVQ
jgi:tRNA(Ile)-lysidine synthase